MEKEMIRAGGSESESQRAPLRRRGEERFLPPARGSIKRKILGLLYKIFKRQTQRGFHYLLSYCSHSSTT
uniref:Uncharacterized protein n=1 Tax=Manihot esculenta TaxID=3983 RepID=A0A2C9WET9_MANES